MATRRKSFWVVAGQATRRRPARKLIEEQAQAKYEREWGQLRSYGPRKQLTDAQVRQAFAAMEAEKEQALIDELLKGIEF